MNQNISHVQSLRGIALVPGDKSISHRALIFGAIAHGETRIKNLLKSGDVLSTKKCLEKCGVRLSEVQDEIIVYGRGRNSLSSPTSALDCENSGTSIRLLMALVAGENLNARMTGDKSLIKRPMKRIADPLKQMGAEITLTDENFAPLELRARKNKNLKALCYDLKIASAQLKSALIIAALYASETTKLKGLLASRDHTEKMLQDFGVKMNCSQDEILIEPNQALKAIHIQVPGDPSSAAFWLAAGCLVPNSEIEIHGVSLNPTRTGFLKVLIRMGANIEATPTKQQNEPIGNLKVKTSTLKATEIREDEIASLIDEVPILAIVATQAQGKTIIRGAGELRVKESDRIDAIANNLRAMGVVIETFEDGFSIEGPQKLRGAKIDSAHDHRIAMSFSIAALIATGETEICDTDSVGISYPEFYSELAKLRGQTK